MSVDCAQITAVIAAFFASMAGIAIIIAVAVAALVLGIFDIIVATKWDECHLDQDHSPDIYLYVLGGLTLGAIALNAVSTKKKDGEDDDKDCFGKLAALCGMGCVGVLIWGMTIFFDTEQGDCNPKYYDYAYYRTLVVMFMLVAAASVAVLVGSCACAIGCCVAIKG